MQFYFGANVAFFSSNVSLNDLTIEYNFVIFNDYLIVHQIITESD